MLRSYCTYKSPNLAIAMGHVIGDTAFTVIFYTHKEFLVNMANNR